MTNQEIYELLARFENSVISELRLKDGDFSIELKKPPAAASAPVAAAQVQPQASQTPERQDEAYYINAPLIGTFYASPAPGDEPFVTAGQTVKAGQSLCLMEAMKMMSEVPAPCDCVIEACLQKDGALVEYDAPLFRCTLV